MFTKSLSRDMKFSETNINPNYYHKRIDPRLYDPLYAGRLIRKGFSLLKQIPVTVYPAGNIRDFHLCKQSTLRLSYWETSNCSGAKRGCIQLGKVMHTIYMEEEHEVDLDDMIIAFNNFMKNNREKLVQQIIES